MMRAPSFSLSLLPLSLLATLASAFSNITIDDTDSQIVYSGLWDPSSTHRSSLDYGGSHTFSSDPTASATFKFTGVAVYFLAPLWPYSVTTQISLNGGVAEVLNLTDPLASTTSTGGSESALSAPVWSKTGLKNTSHTVVVSMGPAKDGIVVDGFMYTVDDGKTSSSVSASATSAGSSSPTTSGNTPTTTAKPDNNLAIYLGAGLGAVALIAAALAYYIFFWRRSRRREHRVLFDLNEDPALPMYDTKVPPVTPFIAGARGGGGDAYLKATETDAEPLLAPSSQSGSAPYSDSDEPGSRTSAALSRYSSASASASTSANEAGPSSGRRLSVVAAAATSGAAIAGSGRGEKSRPLREEVLPPAPPAYSE
ncbi:hypothetical protein MKEN_00489000 [Mycena kentingensis (nom. inval.)]|nr:hypothetical protein MKEN_00489000 [Mycena kentingensis (nom. inval.)]